MYTDHMELPDCDPRDLFLSRELDGRWAIRRSDSWGSKSVGYLKHTLEWELHDAIDELRKRIRVHQELTR